MNVDSPARYHATPSSNEDVLEGDHDRRLGRRRCPPDGGGGRGSTRARGARGGGTAKAGPLERGRSLRSPRASPGGGERSLGDRCDGARSLRGGLRWSDAGRSLRCWSGLRASLDAGRSLRCWGGLRASLDAGRSLRCGGCGPGWLAGRRGCDQSKSSRGGGCVPRLSLRGSGEPRSPAKRSPYDRRGCPVGASVRCGPRCGSPGCGPRLSNGRSVRGPLRCAGPAGPRSRCGPRLSNDRSLRGAAGCAPRVSNDRSPRCTSPRPSVRGCCGPRLSIRGPRGPRSLRGRSKRRSSRRCCDGGGGGGGTNCGVSSREV